MANEVSSEATMNKQFCLLYLDLHAIHYNEFNHTKLPVDLYGMIQEHFSCFFLEKIKFNVTKKPINIRTYVKTSLPAVLNKNLSNTRLNYYYVTARLD